VNIGVEQAAFLCFCFDDGSKQSKSVSTETTDSHSVNTKTNTFDDVCFRANHKTASSM